MKSPKRIARIAGILYLLVFIFGGFAEGIAEPQMYVAGNAAATAGSVVAHVGLVRVGVVAELINGPLFLFLALTLYVLLKEVHKGMARAMLVLVALATGITCLGAVSEFEGLRVATGAVDLSSLGVSGSNAVVLLLLDAQHYGLLVAQIFFGLWLAPLGYLAYKSGWFPKALGVALVTGAACYLVDVLAAFLLPDLGTAIHGFVTIPSIIAELWMAGYLLVIGVKRAKISQRVTATSRRNAPRVSRGTTVYLDRAETGLDRTRELT
ncbi:MAG: DUF4386 domain-containing protein [Candidatus Dormiibacterota bacterium]